MRVRWSIWCVSWRGPEYVRLWCGNAHLPGCRSHGYAQRLRGPLRDGAGPLAVRSAEWAYLPVRQRAAQSSEAAVLGRQWTVGVRQAPGEGTLPLAGGCGRGNESRTQPRGIGVIAGGHRSGPDPASAMVPESYSSHTDIRISHL